MYFSDNIGQLIGLLNSSNAHHCISVMKVSIGDVCL